MDSALANVQHSYARCLWLSEATVVAVETVEAVAAGEAVAVEVAAAAAEVAEANAETPVPAHTEHKDQADWSPHARDGTPAAKRIRAGRASKRASRI